MAISETTTRVLVAAIGIPVAVAIIYVGGYALSALIAALGVLGALEFYKLAEKKGARALTGLGVTSVLAFVMAASVDPARGPDGSGFGTIAIASMLIAGATAIWLRGVEGQPLLAWSVTYGGALYVGATLSFALFLRHLPGTDGSDHGVAIVFAPILLTWASDTCAYFVGRAFGRHKLIPKVSPGKTVEGAIGAVVGTVLAALAYSYVLNLFPTYTMAAWQAAILGVTISVAAQLGDLVESLLKRDVGVKDSGRLLPGHGGALDRFDSLFFTLPLGYYIFRFLLGGPEPF